MRFIQYVYKLFISLSAHVLIKCDTVICHYNDKKVKLLSKVVTSLYIMHGSITIY